MSTDDTLFKLRLSRLLWKMGYFVRRNIPVSTYTLGKPLPKRIDITDIDVLGIRWDEDFTPDRVVCECKSGSKAKPLDRSFWLRGVMHYFGARKGYLLVKESGMIPGNVGARMGVTVIDRNLLTDLEKRYEIENEYWIGSCNPEIDFNIPSFRKMLREPVRRQLNYILYGYWRDPEYYQIKRLITTGKTLSGKFQPSIDAYRWLAFECINLFAISVLGFCNKLFVTEPRRIPEETSTELFGGFLSRTERQGILSSALRLMRSYIEKTYQEKFPLRLEHINLNPDYFDKLVDLLARLMSRPNESKLLPSFLDLFCYGFLYKNKKPSKEELEYYTGNHDVYLLTKLAKNVVEFYLESTSLNRDVFEPILSF